MTNDSPSSSHMGRRIALGCGAFTLAILLTLVGFTVWLLMGTSPTDSPVQASKQPISGSREGTPEGQRTVLLLGVDGNGQSVIGQRSDMILLNRIINGRLDSVSIPRDLLVDMPPCTEQAGSQKINGIFAYSSAKGGIEQGVTCLAQKITELSGVPIDDYVVVNMDSVVTLVNEVGGIELCLDQREIEEHIVQDATTPGCQNVNGEQALNYAQARKYVDDGSDLSRINRQHQVLSALLSKIKSMDPLGNLPTMLALASKMKDSTFSNLGFTDARTVVQLSRTLARITVPPAITLPVDPASDGANLLLSPAAEPLFEALRTGTELPTAH